ncbi:hypothetical protein [Saccharothrix sp. HUAS TT1]|uniref:hypothetical protein n=1 Tax=unclassified Saccharothrix TaxID=2593673 RepID=UPI00345C0202
MEDLDVKALVDLVHGRSPSSGRKFKPEAVQKRQKAEDVATFAKDDVVEPVRTWLEELRGLLDAADEAADDGEKEADSLLEAENGDAREEHYGSLDEALSSLSNALDALGVDVSDFRKKGRGRMTDGPLFLWRVFVPVTDSEVTEFYVKGQDMESAREEAEGVIKDLAKLDGVPRLTIIPRNTGMTP